MVETAHPGKRDDLRARTRTLLRRSAIGRVLLEPEVTPIGAVVLDILSEKPAEVGIGISIQGSTFIAVV